LIDVVYGICLVLIAVWINLHDREGKDRTNRQEKD